MTRKNYFRIILLLLFLRSSGEVFAVTDDADENIVEQFVTLFSLPQAEQSARLAGHRAFWFGWHSAFPDTILIVE